MLEKLLQWDRDTFIYLNGLGIEAHDAFWSIVTQTSTWIPLFLLFGYLLVSKYGRQEGVYRILTILLMVALVLIVTKLTKEWVGRLRPNNDTEINTLIRILKSPDDYSFFSGHAATSFSITLLAFLFLRERLRWTALFFAWPIVFSMSRIFVGVHYPIDILTGMFFGLLSAFLFYRLHPVLSALCSRLSHRERAR
ncbi:phosphatase PAP2 family protein [Allomuricauda sp. SCSIO 65647]|uniref:phosphatase PAP2 family protein n=1 Tax=Allomuricauda sp. SCSIO 65647 TaxID=2908843 RepID=UPI001F30FE44|nr:phosphatase PAP2 family protein [Muricauda sp. SCSIO 65647]UJH68144.1 phosphatase PAP2 family protein [Muricauda sp. SCSIO 65647]